MVMAKTGQNILRNFVIIFCFFYFYCCSPGLKPISQPLWEFSSQFPIVFLCNLEKTQIGVKSINQYLMLDKSNGNIVKSIPLESYGLGGAILDGSRIYYGTVDYRFLCVDVNTGEKLWTFNTLSENKATPSLDSQMVYWASLDSSIYAVDKFSGTLQWKITTGCHINSTPLLSDSILLIGSWDTHLYALHKKTGRELWRFSASSGIDQKPLLIGQTVWLPSYDSHVYGINLHTGEKEYDFTADNAFEFSGSRWKNTLIFSGIDRNFYFIDLDSGQFATREESPVAVSTSLMVYADWLFTGQYDGCVYSWELPSMKKKLLHRFKDRVIFLLSDGEYLWAASWDRTLVCFRLSSD
jgi:outer membrane protein assembly factor BamB